MKHAIESEERWRNQVALSCLDGIPISIKDLILTKGWPTLRGSNTVDINENWNFDAPVVKKLRDAGAIILGKTATPEFGHKGTTQSLRHGSTKNPWNILYNAGGSSGGSAAAIASGMGPLSIGTDGGGSVRIPCSFSGLFGLKPTFGRIPAYPLSPFGTIANLGPMSRKVFDSAMLMNIISKPDGLDWHSLPYREIDYRDYSLGKVKHCKIGYSEEWGMHKCMGNNVIEDDIKKTMYKTIQELTDLGVTVEKIEIEWPRDPTNIFRTMWYSGAANLARKLSEDQKKKLDPIFNHFCRIGEKHSMFDLMDVEAARSENGVYINKYFLDGLKALIGPTMPITAFDSELNVPKGWGEDLFAWTPFTFPFNLTKNPSSSVNCGFNHEGLPIGMQVVGPLFKDEICFEISALIELVSNTTDQWPNM